MAEDRGQLAPHLNSMREMLKTVWPYLWRYRRGWALGMGALILKDVLGAAQPLIVRAGIDSLMSGFRIQIVLEFAALLVIFAAAKGLFQYWMRVILIGISRDIEYDLRNDLFGHLVTLDGTFYSRYRTGDILARATNDLNAVRMMLGPGVMYWCETMFTLILAVGVMLSVDWPLTLIALAPAPLVSVAVVLFGRRIHDRFEVIQKMFSDISNRVQENLSGTRVLRAYAQEAAELKRFDALNVDYIAQNIRLARLSSLFMPLLQALIALAFLIVLWAGGIRLLRHSITLGSFVMFNTYTGMLVWPMIAMGWVVNLLQRGSASLGRIMEMLRERPVLARPADARALPEPFRGQIEFRGVTVRYAAGEALKNVSLRIPAGATVAIVGHTGSGKTTLVNLIPRLLDPAEGAVLLDGIDVRELDPADVRRQIGFVPQETFLFSDTLAGNIAFGAARRPDAGDGAFSRAGLPGQGLGASKEMIREAAEIAGLAPDIDAFPAGYETMVGERGITLSGGQKQRTAIARAIFRDPRILILDDALSSVDTLTEERILSGLAGILRGRTTILISHRVSTVRNAGMIFVLAHGEIVEQGTHTELLASGGYYADLHQKQLLEEELEAI